MSKTESSLPVTSNTAAVILIQEMTLKDYKRKEKINIFEYCVRQSLHCKKNEDDSIGITKASEEESLITEI